MKKLTESHLKNIKKLINKEKIELKKIIVFIMFSIMVTLHMMVLKILDICLMKRKMKMLMMSDIF